MSSFQLIPVALADGLGTTGLKEYKRISFLPPATATRISNVYMAPGDQNASA